MPLCFYEGRTFIPFLTNPENLEDFHFHKVVVASSLHVILVYENFVGPSFTNSWWVGGVLYHLVSTQRNLDFSHTCFAYVVT